MDLSVSIPIKFLFFLNEMLKIPAEGWNSWLHVQISACEWVCVYKSCPLHVAYIFVYAVQLLFMLIVNVAAFYEMMKRKKKRF